MSSTPTSTDRHLTNSHWCIITRNDATESSSSPEGKGQEDILTEVEDEDGAQQALTQGQRINYKEALRALRIVQLYFIQEEIDPQQEFFPDFVQMRGGIIRAGEEQKHSKVDQQTTSEDEKKLTDEDATDCSEESDYSEDDVFEDSEEN